MSLDAETIDLLKMPSIADQMPIRFEGTDFIIDHANGECQRCKKAIPNHDFRGQITRAVPSIVTIEARGLCRNCNLVTAFRFRVNHHGDFSQLIGHEWCTGTLRPELPIWRRHLRRFLRVARSQ